MGFDKAAYWAQKGRPRAKGRTATIVMCGACGQRGTCTYAGGRFICRYPAMAAERAAAVARATKAAEAAPAAPK